MELQSSFGSGFVFDKEGHIITNNHVVENAKKISVTFVDGISYRRRASLELILMQTLQ